MMNGIGRIESAGKRTTIVGKQLDNIEFNQCRCIVGHHSVDRLPTAGQEVEIIGGLINHLPYFKTDGDFFQCLSAVQQERYHLDWLP